MSLLIAAAVLFAAFALLGLVVAPRAAGRLDLTAASVRGTGVSVAAAFTTTGRTPALVLLSIAIAMLFAVMHWSLWIPAIVVASQLASQAAVEGLKRLYRRNRPDWLLRHETGLSYPSGHATTSITFFGGWATVLLLSPAPRAAKVAGVIVLVIWMLGIDWSRLALAAHYATDVIGGTLFGCGWLCLVAAAVVHVRGALA